MEAEEAALAAERAEFELAAAAARAVAAAAARLRAVHVSIPSESSILICIDILARRRRVMGAAQGGGSILVA